MSESVPSYKNLIERAYIAPIRSVVVVDDDFPTLDQLLASAINPVHAKPTDLSSADTAVAADTGPATENSAADGVSSELMFSFKGVKREVARAADLIRACRDRKPPWTVDIHDGSPNDGVDEVILAPTLHHSDLMILDYHLNGDAGDGGRAIEILRALAKNGQFNLVVVFTKGIDGDLSQVFSQILTGLLHEKCIGRISEPKLSALRKFLGDWEDASGNDVSGLLKEKVSTASYLRERSGEDVFATDALAPIFETLLASCPKDLIDARLESGIDGGAQQDKISPLDLFSLGLDLRHKELQPLQSKIDLGEVRSKYRGDGNWLRLDQLFVTIVNKGNATPADLVDRLTAALIDWEPGPHQLLMTKMRNQLGENGVLAEAGVLADEPLQAGWLHQLLGDDDAESVMSQSVSRHWDALGGSVFSGITDYARELVDYFRSLDRENVFKRHLRISFEKSQRLAHLNHYYSNKPIDSTHLTTGHILEFRVNSADGGVLSEYWVCLSPACDLVPGQKKDGWRSRLGEALPFIGVQLTKAPDLAKALKDVNHNRHVFIKSENGDVLPLVFTDSKSTSMPAWEQMFALNSGILAGSVGTADGFSLVVQRLHVERVQVDAASGLGEGGDFKAPDPAKLGFTTLQARVVSQLRYEYALNFLQKLGGSLSRVGLDFQM